MQLLVGWISQVHKPQPQVDPQICNCARHWPSVSDFWQLVKISCLYYVLLEELEVELEAWGLEALAFARSCSSIFLSSSIFCFRAAGVQNFDSMSGCLVHTFLISVGESPDACSSVTSATTPNSLWLQLPVPAARPWTTQLPRYLLGEQGVCALMCTSQAVWSSEGLQ